MKPNGTHIINKLRIDLNLPASQESHQNELLAKVKCDVLAGIEELGKRLEDDSEHSIIRFDRLAIEVNVHTNDLKSLEKQIESAILKEIKSAQKKETKSRTVRGFTESNTPEKRDEKLLVFYLRNGRFPWWASENDSLQQIEKQLVEMPQTRLENELLPLLRRNPDALGRLSAQFTEHTILQLLKRLVSEDSSSEMKMFFEAYRRFIRETKPPVSLGKLHRTEKALHCEALRYAAGIISDKKELLERWTASVIDAFSSVNESDRSANLWIDWLGKSPGKNKNEWLTAAKKIETNIFSQNEKLTKQSDSEEVLKAMSESDEGYDVPQAGLVLLHPFIKRLFDNLGLLNDGMFADDEKQERAVCLLHYLATGEEQFDEPKLALPMMLCGWPMGVPVHRFLPVSEYEKEECGKVLSSAVHHWGALKKTTPEGLRENFLRRNGRLKKGSFGWTLHVEEKTQDILLDQLPWGISAVAFSWMKQHLTVQWRNS